MEWFVWYPTEEMIKGKGEGGVDEWKEQLCDMPRNGIEPFFGSEIGFYYLTPTPFSLSLSLFLSIW